MIIVINIIIIIIIVIIIGRNHNTIRIPVNASRILPMTESRSFGCFFFPEIELYGYCHEKILI